MADWTIIWGSEETLVAYLPYPLELLPGPIHITTDQGHVLKYLYLSARRDEVLFQALVSPAWEPLPIGIYTLEMVWRRTPGEYELLKPLQTILEVIAFVPHPEPVRHRERGVRVRRMPWP